MKAIIMAGGFGTRLRPLTINTPKPMVPIGNLPMMEHVVNLLKRHGFDEIVSLLFFQSDVIKDHFRDGRKFGVKMEYLQPDQDFGTAGAVRHAADFCNETVLVISGDVLTDFDLTSAFRFHQEKEGDATILLTRMENPLAFGIVITDADNRITRFMEKPSWGEMFSDTINTGVYILEPKTVRLIPPKTNFDFSQNLFPVMLQKNMNLLGKIATGYWRDIGNIDEYTRAHRDILEGKVDLTYTTVRQERDGAVIYSGRDVVLPESVACAGTVMLGNNCRVGENCHLTNSMIGENAVLGESAEVTDTVIWGDTTIEPLTSISGAIITNRVQIGRNVSILDKAVISDDCRIGAGATVRANCKIWPGKVVDEGATVSSSIVWGEKWNRELFSDSKVSGLGLTEITPEMAVKLGAAFGASLGRKQRIIASRDASDATRLLKRSIMCGLMATGVDVDDLEILPTPVLRHALKNGRYAAGIYIRHNPIDFNSVDIIFFDGSGQDLPTSTAKKVERSFINEDFPRASMVETGHLEQEDRLFDFYKEDFLHTIDDEKVKTSDFRVVIDYSYGSVGQFFPAITSALGIDVLSLNGYPNPSKASEHSKNLKTHIHQLSTIVSSLSADLGLMINPAAEKMIVIDEKGREISNQLILLMISELYLQTHSVRRIAVPVDASMGMEKIASEFNVEVLRVRNDHLAMMDAHLRSGVDFVGGTRGGFIFPGFQIGADAMYAVVKLLEMMATTGVRLGDRSERFDNFIRKTVSVPCPWGKKGQVMRTLINSTENKQRQLIDGVRVFVNGGWVLVAPDRQTASFGILAEGESQDVVDRIVKEYSELVETSQS
ncbi:MAG: NTP transferase domain-containing protein [FCB group bacterium]|nr:NTP transferase domain-containing protein [FCB group bacterium]